MNRWEKQSWGNTDRSAAFPPEGILTDPTTKSLHEHYISREEQFGRKPRNKAGFTHEDELAENLNDDQEESSSSNGTEALVESELPED